MNENAKIFSNIYEKNLFFGTESISGPGSSVGATEKLRTELPEVLRSLGVKRIVDAPCGDMNWIRHLDFKFELFIGADIVPDLIAKLRREFASEHYHFQVIDLCQSILPKADALLVRDCLVHFSYEMIRSALRMFKLSMTQFLMTTTFPEHDNTDLPTGGWRPLNLERQPFSWPRPIVAIRERAENAKDPWNDKSLAIWSIATLP